MLARTLKVPASELGLASLDAQARDMDWSDPYGEEGDGGEAWEIQLPRVTYGAISDHAPDLLTKAQQRVADRNPDRLAPSDLADAFEQSEGHDQWRASFDPIMNYVWPAFLPYGLDARDLADRLDRFAPVMSLVYFGEHSPHCPEPYGFALTGGGMNLADQIAAAYLCAHQVPPVSILDGLAGVIGDSMRKRIGQPLRAAYRKAAQHLRYRAKRIAQESGRVFKA